MDKKRIITYDQYCENFAKAIEIYIREHPHAILIAEELAVVGAISCELLFKDKR